MLRDKEQQYAFQHAHPFSSSTEELASTAYKYRKWQLTPDLALIARCEVDGTTDPAAQVQAVSLGISSPRPARLGDAWLSYLRWLQVWPRARTIRSSC
jgi:hypothetical protein